VLLDQRDVHLCAALNAGYLLRLSLGPVLGLATLAVILDSNFQRRNCKELSFFIGNVVFDFLIYFLLKMVNINAVMPKTKLVFRPADALRIDFVSAISLVVIFFQQKFRNTRLDLIALVSVSVWVKEHFRRHLNS